MSFSGEFRSSHPSRWVPVPWTPCRLPHLMLTADEPECANILFEDSSGVRCVTLARSVTPFELTEGTADSSRGVRVLGSPHIGTHVPLDLRDGDVVVTGPLMHRDEAAWPDMRGLSAYTGISWSVSTAFCFGLIGHRVSCLAGLLLPMVQAARGNGADRIGRSRSPPPDAPARCPSPRIGGWRPERRHQMGTVSTRSECHLQVLCPFRGWGSPFPYTRTIEASQLLRVVQRDSGTWASAFLPLGSDSIEQFTVLLPLPPAPLANVVLHSSDTSRAVLMPASLTMRQVTDFLAELVPIPNLQVLVPPSLRRLEGYTDEVVRLRHGDTFELETRPWHPRVRRCEAFVVPDLQQLPHLNVWHRPVVVRIGGWASVWGTADDGTSYSERHWIPDGALWSPRWLGFSLDGRTIAEGRWIPTAYIPDHDVAFGSHDISAAHVLLVQPYDHTATACRCLLLDPSVERTALNRVSEEWQLRPDIQARVVSPWPRNGDIMVPRVLSSVFHSGVFAAVATWSRRPGLALLGLVGAFSLAEGAVAQPLPRDRLGQVAPCLSLIGLPLVSSMHPVARSVVGGVLLAPFPAAMVAPPLEQQHLPAVPIGKYPWRVPSALRLCGNSVVPGTQARLISPFCGESEPVEVTPDTPIDDLRISLSGVEPFWYREITSKIGCLVFE